MTQQDIVVAANRPNPITPMSPRQILGPDYGLFELRQAMEQLTQQAGMPASPAAQPTGANPDHQMYGIFGPQYAAALGRTTGATGADILNRAALMGEASNERQAYSDALEAAQRGAMERTALEGANAMEVALINHDGTPVISGTRRVERGPDGRPSISYNAIPQMLDNQLRGGRSWSETRQANAAAVASAAAAGIRTPPETFSGYQTHPASRTADPYGVWNTDQYTPGQQNDAEKVDIDRERLGIDRFRAETDRIEANNPSEYDTRTYIDADGRTVVRSRRNAPAGGGTASAPSPAQSQAGAAAAQRGHEAEMVGSVLRIRAPSGATVYIGPDGSRVAAPTEGGASPQGSNSFPPFR